jgi:hypothetical protein
VLAVVLQCHRAFSRCSSVLHEIESSPFQKYFSSEESKKKNYKRLLRAVTEMREIVLAAYRGRNEVLRAALSLQAYEALQSGLEDVVNAQKHIGTPSSKEGSIRAFLANSWVTDFQDVDIVDNLAIPEQVSNGQIYRHRTATNRGRLAIEELASESKAIVNEYDRALNGPFERTYNDLVNTHCVYMTVVSNMLDRVYLCQMFPLHCWNFVHDSYVFPFFRPVSHFI